LLELDGMKWTFAWLGVSALAWGCSDGAPESSDDEGRGGDIGNPLPMGARGGTGNSGGSGGVGGDIDGGLGKGSGGTGNSSVDTTLPECVGAERLVLTLTENGQSVFNTGPLEFQATLTASTDDSALLETCPGGDGEDGAGGAGASGDESCLTLEIQAIGLDLLVDVGMTVNVLWDMTGGGGTAVQSMVVLRTVGNESIGGFLLGVENGLPIADSPISYTSTELDCAFVPPTNLCGERKAYELTFTAVDNPSSSVSLTMGEQDRLELDPNAYTKWRVHNLRSMTSGGCDAVEPTQYYIVQE
jgi:hypothetical protein